MKTTNVEKLVKHIKKDINTLAKMLKDMASFETEDIGQETPIETDGTSFEGVPAETIPETPELSVEDPNPAENETAPIE